MGSEPLVVLSGLVRSYREGGREQPLDDSGDLVLPRLRRGDGAASPFSAGVLVAPDGTARRLRAADAEEDVWARWWSPVDGTAYPSAWRIRVPSPRLELAVEAARGRIPADGCRLRRNVPEGLDCAMATILIIDDDPAIRATMRRILERVGHEVIEAENGRKGFALFRRRNADVVVTDLIMPEQEGIETILQLKEEFPDVRVLAVSGGGAVGPGGPLGDAEAFGADASLAKPFGIVEFRRAVESLLQA